MDKERNYIEVDGDSVEDAIKKGINLLKTSAENVDIEIISEPANGFLKFGRKKARVRITLLIGTVPQSLLKSQSEQESGKRHERISIEDAIDKSAKERPEQRPQRKDVAGNRREEEKRPHREKTGQYRQYREQKPQDQYSQQQREFHEKKQAEMQRAEPVLNSEQADQPYIVTDEDKINIEKINQVFMKLTALMGFDVEPEISALGNKYRIIIKDTPDASLLIGKNGKTIEALQHIVNKISMKESVNKPVYLDIKGYVKQKRKNRFEKRWKREKQ